MASGHIPSRFVPTLTDVVGEAAPLPPARPTVPPPAANPVSAPAATRVQPSPAAPVIEPVMAPVMVLTPELEAAIAERVQALVLERLRRAFELELRDLQPLVQQAVNQALARR